MRVSALETSFPAGCNIIMQAVTAKGVTPASNSPSDIATAIGNISSGIDSSLAKQNYTEQEFLDYICTREIFDNNLAGMFVGKTVSIYNSLATYDTVRWTIVGCNHQDLYTDDSTKALNTFDLWSEVCILKSKQFNNTSVCDYSISTIRDTLLSLIDGFSTDVKNRLKPMTFSFRCNTQDNTTALTTKILYDEKIKLMGIVEAGVATNGPTESEINQKRYEYFYPKWGGYNHIDLYRSSVNSHMTNNGTGSSYFFRDASNYSGSGIQIYHYGSYIEGSSPTSSQNIHPVIRIGIVD